LDKLHLFQDSTLEAPTLLLQLEPKDMVQLMMLEHTTDQNQRSGSGNLNLKPEIKTETEFGADLEFFRRFTINATYYTNETTRPCRCSIKRFFD
jgi:hypothetical protein